MAPQIRNIGGPDMAPDSPQAVAGPSPGSGQQRPVLAVVKDLFFVARIRETARLAGAAPTKSRRASPGPVCCSST